ncbi:MAG: DNA polymerase III subunit delta [Myxococcales bacterium]|nr:MAG: DNA polymerase III subunit delta [Myxococcales bacterium]
MTPADLEKELKAGKVRPVYVLAGEERYLSDQAARLLRKQLVDPSMADFNEDTLSVGDSGVTAERILSAVRTAPMMADRRFVLVRGIERWEGRGDASKDDDKKKEGPLDLLARYAEAPVDSACLVLMAGKLDSRRRLAALAKKQNFLVSCEPLDRRALRGWIEQRLKTRGHALDPGVAEHLAEIAGPELGHVADAVERLALYVGAGQKITADAAYEGIVRTCVSLARGLNLKVVAEGVETEGQAAALRALGCDQAQGFYYSPPVPAEQLMRMLKAGPMHRPG